jgi:hypothetical protein
MKLLFHMFSLFVPANTTFVILIYHGVAYPLFQSFQEWNCYFMYSDYLCLQDNFCYVNLPRSGVFFVPKFSKMKLLFHIFSPFVPVYTTFVSLTYHWRILWSKVFKNETAISFIQPICAIQIIEYIDCSCIDCTVHVPAWTETTLLVSPQSL